MAKSPTRWGHVPGPNPGLPVIHTGRTEKSINKATKQGLRIVLVDVTPSPQVYDTLFLFQNTASGEIAARGDVRGVPSGWEHIRSTTHYPYQFPSPIAAYLVPPDLPKDTRVWLEDVIEDILAAHGNQGHNPRLASAEAIWNGNTFEIQFDKDDIPMWIG
jgi:hypothetical protein